MKTAIILLVCSSCTWSGLGGRFKDLGLDEDNTDNLVAPVPPGNPPYTDVGSGTPADLLPGWQLQLASGPYMDPLWVNVNPPGLGLASLYNRDNLAPFPHNRFPVDGLYSFAMWPDYSVGGFRAPYT